MSIKTIEDSSLTAIAEAIRDKNGETTTYTPAEMAPAIEALDTSGGGGETSISEYELWHRPSEWPDLDAFVESLGEDFVGFCAYCDTRGYASSQQPLIALNSSMLISSTLDIYEYVDGELIYDSSRIYDSATSAYHIPQGGQYVAQVTFDGTTTPVTIGTSAASGRMNPIREIYVKGTDYTSYTGMRAIYLPFCQHITWDGITIEYSSSSSTNLPFQTQYCYELQRIDIKNCTWTHICSMTSIFHNPTYQSKLREIYIDNCTLTQGTASNFSTNYAAMFGTSTSVSAPIDLIKFVVTNSDIAISPNNFYLMYADYLKEFNLFTECTLRAYENVTMYFLTPWITKEYIWPLISSTRFSGYSNTIYLSGALVDSLTEEELATATDNGWTITTGARFSITG